mgnify:CR=1 FL=1
MREPNEQGYPNFEELSEAYVKHYATRLHCPSKSKALISYSSRKKAWATNVKKWEQKARNVDNIAEYIRSMRVREIRICRVNSDIQVCSYRNAISKFNQNEGYDAGIFLTSQYIKEAKLMRIEARVNVATN